MTKRSNVSLPQQASAEGLDYIKPKLNEMQAAILANLKLRGFHGATDSELAWELGIGDNARKRRGELCKQGYVAAAGKRPACDGYGRAVGPTKQTVWVAQEFASQAYQPKDLASVEAQLKVVMTAGRRLKRALRSSDTTPDVMYAKHMAFAEAYARYNAVFWPMYQHRLPKDTCDECFGDGKLKTWYDCTDGVGEHTTRECFVECEKCHGTGEIESAPWED